MSSSEATHQDGVSSIDSKYTDEIVEEASRFLVSVLRHGGPDEVDVTVNSRGWLSGKSARTVLQKHFNTEKDLDCSKLFNKILKQDDESRLQVITDDPLYTMVRARYGHTLDHIQLYDLQVDEEDLNTYIVKTDEKRKSYISAVNEDVAVQIFVERVVNNMNIPNMDEITVTEADSVNLSLKSTPYYHYTQPVDMENTERRCNSQGIESEYIITNSRDSSRHSA